MVTSLFLLATLCQIQARIPRVWPELTSLWRAEGEAPLLTAVFPHSSIHSPLQGAAAQLHQGLALCPGSRSWGSPGAGRGAGSEVASGSWCSLASRGVAMGREAGILEKRMCRLRIQWRFWEISIFLGGPGQNFKIDRSLPYIFFVKKKKFQCKFTSEFYFDSRQAR